VNAQTLLADDAVAEKISSSLLPGKARFFQVEPLSWYALGRPLSEPSNAHALAGLVTVTADH